MELTEIMLLKMWPKMSQKKRHRRAMVKVMEKREQVAKRREIWKEVVLRREVQHVTTMWENDKETQQTGTRQEIDQEENDNESRRR